MHAMGGGGGGGGLDQRLEEEESKSLLEDLRGKLESLKEENKALKAAKVEP